MKIKVRQKDEHSMFSNMMFFMSLLFYIFVKSTKLSIF